MIGWVLIGLVLAATALEWIASRRLYDTIDTLTNLWSYAIYVVIVALWSPSVFAIYSWAHDFALFDFGPYWLDPSSPWFWLLWGALFVLEDFTFYWFHRASHRIPFFWAAHVTHHSSARYNLSVGFRQSWTPFIAFPFWLWLPLLGFDPLMVLGTQFMSLFYQAWLHTENVGGLGPLEWILNTPTHHRVHHGANEVYVDKNFGGVLIVWDRLFGTFVEFREPVRYGIGRIVNHPLVGLHGWLDLFSKSAKEINA
jgi:sterol desaturase/sphingolipid hydroxylase (fatty acid hydroxylase superfamily)